MRAGILAPLLLVFACGGPAKPPPPASNTKKPPVAAKPPPVSKCREACVRYFTLVFREDADQRVAAAAESERDALRRTLDDKFQTDLAAGADACAKQCEASNNTPQVECIRAAATAADARACMRD